MASFIYDEGRKLLGSIGTHVTGPINWDTVSVMRYFYVDEADDTISQTADVDVADRASAAQIPAFASTSNIANFTSSISSSVLVVDADDHTYTSLTGDAPESYDIFYYNTTDTVSPLFSNHDDATGLGAAFTGGNVTLVWSTSGIFRF
jgi:hypothetical protein